MNFFMDIKSLLYFPRTLYILITNVFLNRDKNVAAFNKVFAAVQYWYFFVSSSIMNYGWNGYSYEMSLGKAIKDNFFNTYLGYGLLLKYFKKPYRLIQYTVWGILITSICMFIWTNNLNNIWILVFFISSPLFVYGFVHSQKPESFIWIFFLWMMFFLYKSQYVISSILYLIISMSSITVFALTMPIVIMSWMVNILSFKESMIIAVPSIMCICYQAISFILNTDVKAFIKYLNWDASKRNNNFIKRIFYGYSLRLQEQAIIFIWLAIYLLFGAIIYLSRGNLLSIVLILVYIYVIVLNMCILRYADNPSFLKMGFCILILINIIEKDLYIEGISIILLFLEERFFYAFSIPRLKNMSKEQFPYINKSCIVTQELEKKFSQVFKKVCSHERILLEITGHFVYRINDIRNLQSILSYYLVNLNISVLPEEWFAINHREYADELFKQLEHGKSCIDLIQNMKDMGARYILVYTEKTAVKLEESGQFDCIGRFFSKELGDIHLGVGVNEDTIFKVFELKEEVNLVEGCREYRFENNNIHIYATSYSECLLRITYDKRWKIKQNKGKIQRINYKGLNYIKVIFKEEEQLELYFK